MNSILRLVAVLAAAYFVASTSATQPYSTSNVQSFFTAAPAATPSDEQKYEDLYHRIWLRIKLTFAFRDRLSNWGTWEHKFDGTMTNLGDCRAKTALMLDSLKDPYTHLTDPTAGDDDDTDTVSHQLLAQHIGYVKIPTFSKHGVAKEVEAALLKLKSARAYVLDLRDNGGGYVDDSYQTFTLFVNDGVFVYMTYLKQEKPILKILTVAKKMTNLDVLEDGRLPLPKLANLTGDKPLVVLVNQDTASAAEMIAGALKENHRAILVGTKTFGKGIAQTTYIGLPFAASFQLTDSWWFLPSGICIHRLDGIDSPTRGITPNYVVQPGEHGDAQLAFAKHLLRIKTNAK